MNQIKNSIKKFIKNLVIELLENQNPYLWALVGSIVFTTMIFIIFHDDITVAVQLFSK